MKRGNTALLILAVFTLMSGAVSAYRTTAHADTDGPLTVGSAEAFDALLKETMELNQTRGGGAYYGAETELANGIRSESIQSFTTSARPMPMPIQEEAMATSSGLAMTQASQASVDLSARMGGETGYSVTNTQVSGVDEADVIKTDGAYLYHVVNNTLYITRADGQGQMEKLSETAMADGAQDEVFWPSELYVDGDTLCLIGVASKTPSGVSAEAYTYMSFRGPTYVKAAVYDISDRAAPKLTRAFYVEGSLVSSRKVNDTLYLVANHYMNFYDAERPRDVVPLYKNNQEDFRPVSFATMRYFTGQRIDSFLVVCGLDLADPKADAAVESILGSGGNMYMSADALYVTRNDYLYTIAADSQVVEGSAAEKTTFYKFALADGKAVYATQGVADGHVLNQYAMDEYDGYFRAALTVARGREWKNALVVFDGDMRQTGKVDDIAPGEIIYSTRFMGERAFMVTYRTVDPLFAIDLSDPRSPKVLGELKIPGYSSYLHPYDENHLLGFGRDTEEMRTLNSKGEVVNTWAESRGLKLSLFDVSDMTKPKELSSVTIGDAYTYSELESNPKALLFSKEKGFAAFPVMRYSAYDRFFDVEGGKRAADNFVGAYVYNVDTAGIALRGTIDLGDMGKDEQGYGFSYDKTAQRVLYVGDVFYTASTAGVQANAIGDLKYIGAVKY